MADDNGILFIQTGGTIDKEYPRTTGGYSFEFGDMSAAQKIVSSLRPGVSFEPLFTSVAKKDSQEITEDDRDRLVSVIRVTRKQRIVVTHGTDTLIQTAEYVDRRVSDKVVVFTGSFLPEAFKGSDAGFNVGVAVGAAQSLTEAGVYVCMGGAVIPASMAQRCTKTGIFEYKEE